MRNIDEKKYEQYVKQLTPTHSLPLNMAKAFLTHPFKRHSHRVWDLPEDRQIRWCREPCSHYRFCQFGSSIRH